MSINAVETLGNVGRRNMTNNDAPIVDSSDGDCPMSSILKVSEIQDPTNGNTALSINSSGTVSASAILGYRVFFNRR